MSKTSPVSSTSTTLVVYRPPESQEQLHDLFMRKSFKAQLADHAHLHEFPQVTPPLPKLVTEAPKPVKRSCIKVAKEISSTVHNTMDNLDYNGLQPLVKLTDQLESGKNIQEWAIDSRDEEPGSTCVGQSHILIKNLEKEHGIIARFAVQNDFEHAAVIIECNDGYVFIDPRSNPKDRLFAIPFNTELKLKHFTIKAAAEGIWPPLTLQYSNGAQFEYCADIANGADIVIKEYMGHSITDFFPIVVYNKKDGAAIKNIKVIPSEGKLVLTEHAFLKQNNIITEISFDAIRKGGFEAVAEFMGSDFHVDVKQVYDQLMKFISHHEKVMRVFSSHLK